MPGEQAWHTVAKKWRRWSRESYRVSWWYANEMVKLRKEREVAVEALSEALVSLEKLLPFEPLRAQLEISLAAQARGDNGRPWREVEAEAAAAYAAEQRAHDLDVVRAFWGRVQERAAGYSIRGVYHAMGVAEIAAMEQESQP